VMEPHALDNPPEVALRNVLDFTVISSHLYAFTTSQGQNSDKKAKVGFHECTSECAQCTAVLEHAPKS
jgi:hypothetical protein